VSTLRFCAPGGFVNQQQIGMHSLSECDRRPLTEIQIVGNRRDGLRRHRTYIDPGRRLRDPLSHYGWRTSGGEFTGDGLRHQDLAVKAVEKFDVFQQD
jgi:hypothetical protein